MKKCNTCEQVLPLTEFHRRKASGDGLSYTCKACAVARAAKRFEAKREQCNAERKANYAANRERELASRKAWREANAERSRSIVRDWIARNKERKVAGDEAYRKANPEKMAAHSAAGRARRRRAVPVWADKAAIQKVYDEAALCNSLGLNVHVDHIIPLAGENVCGLHVHNNLRVVLAEKNLAKGNRWGGE